MTSSDRNPQRSQQSLFDEAPWEADDIELRTIATIVFPTGPAQEFDYIVPDALLATLQAGCRVSVPFGRGDRQAQGYCVRVETKPIGTRRLKEIAELVDDVPLLRPTMMQLTRWMSEYYICDWGQVLESVVPAGVRDAAGTRLTTMLSFPPEQRGKLADWKLPKKQLQIMEILEATTEPLTLQQLLRAAHCTAGPITALRRRGLIRSQAVRLSTTDVSEAVAEQEANHELNDDQQLALDSILAPLRASKHETILLHGITGSGKTEVYIRAIQEVVSYGRQAIVLVPEISLTPQVRERFRARFGNVAVLHSHLTNAERHAHWQRISRGEVSVVVGARSAVFAPTPHLGLIVLDEEHESTFKQETAPRYHARDVALFRAKSENVPLVLGSATPSLETYYRAKLGEFQLVEMPRRVYNRPLPDVLTVDLRHESQEHGYRGAISRPLRSAMDQALRDDGQVILLLNRRGYSTHIQCPTCGEPLKCPNCDISLTHHRRLDQALCHYCDYEIPTPRNCPSCHSPEIRFGGYGTEKLEAEVRSRFADYQCLRMDTDSMQKPGSHEKALGRFRDGEAQILVGTQMIAKGLDFPNVTLVGVVNSDTALHLPDFRAAERTFHLLVQVAGRTGRGERGGRVLVQTLSPDHPAIRAAARHDYRLFAEEELANRKAWSYPPFTSMVRMVVRGPREPVAKEFALHFAKLLQEAFETDRIGARLLGPAPAPIARLRGLHRFHLQVQSEDGPALHAAIKRVLPKLAPPDDVQWIVDVDPLDML
ncbi:MAG: primosomal protein N' [Planctomycetia bacterium]|nr:primosomal protein N' [Planctomycetia bacterium]